MKLVPLRHDNNITLPRAYCVRLGLKSRDGIKVELDGDRIIITAAGFNYDDYPPDSGSKMDND